MDALLITASILFWVLIIGYLCSPARKKKREEREEAFLQHLNVANDKHQELLGFIQKNFLVQPCFSCHEFKMRLLDISPNNRSVQYQCVHCGKKMRAAAGTPEASQVADIWRSYTELTKQYDSFPARLRLSHPLMPLEFETMPAPMPYEQTTRTPIPEAVRAEVWRRDRGRCVNCGSKENLHFDHIIPVSRGGATSAKNLQLLCQSCNFTKGAKI
jgi:5-methylcytosine-specific restriction endonuclease McrA